MNWGSSFQSKTSALPATSGLPRRILRHLIQVSGVSIGSRVLHAGGSGGELAGFLSSLGMRVWGLADTPEDIVAFRQDCPDVEIKLGNLQQSPPFDEHTFRLVLVRDLSAHCGPLQTSTALRATAQLLSCVRPGGTLAFIQRIDAGGAHGAVGHQSGCYERHVAHFPGRVQSIDSAEGVIPRAPWHRLVNRPQTTGVIAVSLRIPNEPLQRSGWLRLADDFARAVAEPCCPWAAESQSAYDGLKKAA